MAASAIFLCCLLGSVSIVHGQTLNRLAASDEPSPTDHTGEIISFSAVGSGASGSPRPWVCYTSDTNIVVWQDPNGITLESQERVAVEAELLTRAISAGLSLSRGPTRNSPDGEHCCVRVITNERRCVTFTPCPTLSLVSNGMISYNRFTNMATYSCITGYTVTGTSSSITCNEGTMQWSSTQRPTCELTTCSDSTVPTNGMIAYDAETMNARPVSTTATYTCITGYMLTVTGDMTRTCQANGMWSGTEPTCDLICPDLSVPASGQVLTYSDPTIPRAEGSSATYTCATGYQITGLMLRMCTVTGWSTGDDPVCTAICVDLTVPDNGMVSYIPTSSPKLEGTVASQSCNEGFRASTDGATRTCQSDRTWSGSPFMNCELVDCGPLSDPTNGGVTTTGTIYQLSTAIYNCNNGYIRSGGQTRTCQANGEWSGSEPACNPVNCGALTINNGQVSTSSGTTFMRTAIYTCNPGYTALGGSMTRTCQANMLWSGAAPICDALCPREPLSNGMVTYSPSDDPPPVGAVATYSCDTGYELSGASTRNCVAVDGWSTSLPVCNPVDCGFPNNLSNGAVNTTSGTTFMMTATFTCNTGYTLIGANNQTCGGDGQWTSNSPTCDRTEEFLVVIIPSGRPMAGESFSLTCSLSEGASLQPTLSYQWTREGGSLMTSTTTLNFDTLYLSDAGQYSCRVILTSSQLEGEDTVAAHYSIEFMSLNIQLRLEGITNCRVYTEQDADTKTDDITNSLTQSIESQCACGFNSSLVLNSFMVCFDASPNHVTYRAVLTGSESVSTIQLARLMEKWVENDPIVVVQRAGLSATNSCPVVIANLNSPECPEDITNRIPMANISTSSTTSPTESVVVSVGAVAGGVVAGVLAIAMLVLIVIVLVMLRQRRSGSKNRSDERTGSQPTELPPVVMSNLPSHEYEELSELQEEAAYEVMDPPPPADYQLTACAAYPPMH